MTLTLDDLITRAEITDTVLRYATAIDTRDWAMLRSILTDPFDIDYSSNGGLVGEISVDTWVERLSSLYGFDATRHMITNPVVEVDGDTAVCTSYVDARHYLRDGERDYAALACGSYVHNLVKRGEAWLISSVTVIIAGKQGGAAAFDAAFARARELAPGRRS